MRSDRYCHPLYAHEMSGYGVDINAPRRPFVTITILFRPLKWLWRPVFTFLEWLLADWLPMPDDDNTTWLSALHASSFDPVLLRELEAIKPVLRELQEFGLEYDEAL